MKITLFFCAGAIMVNLHKKNISDLNGIAKVMPWTMAAFTIGSMGLAGIPPVNGFVSKWYLASGALEGGMLVPVIIFVVSGLLNVGYFFPIIQRAYFRKGGPELEGHTEASPFMVVPLFGTAVLSILFGLNPDLFFHFFDMASSVASTIFNSI
jgi:multicomponent Na+:H+ antiporter subunit D